MDIQNFTVRDALELAVTTEQLGAKAYGRLATRFASDREMGELFLRLQRDERAHEKQFQRLFDALPEDQKVGDGRYKVHDYLRATAISEFFGKKAFMRMEEFETREDVLRNAFNLEKNTVLMYQALRDAIGPDPALDEIIETEQAHVVAVMKVIMTDAEFRGVGDTWP
jgi:rubrerythrin